MKDYWDSLQARERLILSIAALFMVILILYLGLIEPYANERSNLEKRVINQQEDLLWMKSAASQFKGSKNRAKPQQASGQSLLSFIDQSTKKNALNSAIKRIQPDGKKVRIQFEKVSFDRLTVWLSKIEASGYSIDGVVVERQSELGKVDARIVIGSAP